MYPDGVDQPPPSLSRGAAFSGRGIAAVAAIALQVFTIAVAVQEEPNKLAAGILQVATFAVGIWASYVFGQVSARDVAKDIIAPHAGAAIRRARSLHRALDQQRVVLGEIYEGLSAEAQPGPNGSQVVDLAAARWAIIGVQNAVRAQMLTASDALQDWSDLLDDGVEAPEHDARVVDEKEAER
jgi:hypothetical protein